MANKRLIENKILAMRKKRTIIPADNNVKRRDMEDFKDGSSTQYVGIHAENNGKHVNGNEFKYVESKKPGK